MIYLSINACHHFETSLQWDQRWKLTNTDTFFSWVPVRRSVTGILKFVAHFWFESVLQCSNFLHWCATMFEFSALLYVYRHANLCSGLRAILSPQLIKKNLQFWAYFRGSGTAQIRTRIAWFTAQCSSNELLNRLMGYVLLSVFIYLIYT